MELPGFLENSFNLIDIFGPSDDSYWLRTNALRYQRLAIYEIRIQIHHQVDDRRRTMHICIRSGHSVTCCFVAQSLNLFVFVLSYTNTQCVKRISISINAMWPKTSLPIPNLPALLNNWNGFSKPNTRTYARQLCILKYSHAFPWPCAVRMHIHWFSSVWVENCFKQIENAITKWWNISQLNCEPSPNWRASKRADGWMERERQHENRERADRKRTDFFLMHSLIMRNYANCFLVCMGSVELFVFAFCTLWFWLMSSMWNSYTIPGTHTNRRNRSHSRA